MALPVIATVSSMTLELPVNVLSESDTSEQKTGLVMELLVKVGKVTDILESTIASEQGYSTLAIDRLGNGLSDHPDPILIVQYPAQVDSRRDHRQSSRWQRGTASRFQQHHLCRLQYAKIFFKPPPILLLNFIVPLRRCFNVPFQPSAFLLICQPPSEQKMLTFPSSRLWLHCRQRHSLEVPQRCRRRNPDWLLKHLHHSYRHTVNNQKFGNLSVG